MSEDTFYIAPEEFERIVKKYNSIPEQYIVSKEDIYCASNKEKDRTSNERLDRK